MKIIALGDNCIDLYRNTGEAFPGGNAVNVAVSAARLGEDAEYLGALGADGMARLVCGALDENGVDRAGCRVIPGSTTKGCVYRVENGERTFVGVLDSASWAGPIRLTPRDMERLGAADAVVSSCNAKIPERIAAVAALPPVFAFDFGEKEKYRTDAYYDTVCASGMDLAMFSMEPTGEEGFAAFCAPLHRRGVRHVLATMGAAGAMISGGGHIARADAAAGEVRDTMGAGDAFLAGTVTALWRAGLRKGIVMGAEEMRAALTVAAEAAARQCALPGGAGVRAMLSADEIGAWERRILSSGAR